MSRKREMDAAIMAAHEATKAPKVVEVPKAATKVPAKVGAPTVKVDKSGHRVRLRNLDHALEGCISGKDVQGGEIRYRLEPNKWTMVSDEVYACLRDKFLKPQSFQVPDWNGDPDNPVRQNRTEAYQSYTIEFPEEGYND